MRVCPHCGKESRVSDRYCLHCGQRLDAGGQVVPDAMPFYVVTGEGGDPWERSQPGAQTHANGTAQSVGGAGTGHEAEPAGAKPAMRLLLQSPEGSAEGPREFALDGSECSIGRAPTCDVVLAEDQLASRRHALLRFEGDRYRVVDLGSSNGTYVNGTEIRDATPLAEGDRIAIGEHEFLYTRAATGEAAVDGAASRAASMTTDGLVAPVPPPWPPAPPQMTDPRVTTVSTSLPRPAAKPTAGAAESAESDIEQLRIRLVDASAALAQRVEESGRDVAQLRATLGKLAEQAAAALVEAGPTLEDAEISEGTPQAAPATTRLDELIQIASHTAENPRHLDYLTALAERAADVTRVLKAQRGLVIALDEIRIRLTELSGMARQ